MTGNGLYKLSMLILGMNNDNNDNSGSKKKKKKKKNNNNNNNSHQWTGLRKLYRKP